MSQLQNALLNIMSPEQAQIIIQAFRNEAIGGGLPVFAYADALPTADEGPIWHMRYSSAMTWRTINGYTGYASVNLGQINYFYQTGTPEGYFPCQGGALALPFYRPLISLIKNMNAPDLRGEFIRTLDAGRGVDRGRILGSYQHHAFTQHTHTTTPLTYLGNTPSVDGSAFSGSPSVMGPLTTDAFPATVSTGASTGYGTETRPRNVAFAAYIKY